MTTIAVKDGIMACDSQEGIHTDGGGARFYAHSEKIYPIYNGAAEDELLYLIGCSGESDGNPLLVEWYTVYCDTDLCDKQILKRMFEFDTDAIILHPSGLIETTSTYGVVHTCYEPFYAIGSGTKCALTAMHMGATAPEAVEWAKKIDPSTGGKVQVFSYV